MNQNGRGNTLTIRCQRAGKSVNYYQDYVITIKRSFSLENLSISCGGVEKVLTHSGGLTGYTPAVWDYIVTVPAAAESLSLCADVYSEDACYRDNGNTGYHVAGRAGTGIERSRGCCAQPYLAGRDDHADGQNEFAGDDTASTYQILCRRRSLSSLPRRCSLRVRCCSSVSIFPDFASGRMKTAHLNSLRALITIIF